MASDAETAAMRRAVEIAAQAAGATNPNPVVGAVVLSPAGSVLAEGHHAVAGGPHAEVVALQAAGAAARGATLVVTLEPCRHTGRTGPCTRAVLEAGISRVVVAVADPFRSAAGGAAELSDAGVDVETGLLPELAARDNQAWLTAVARGRPHVTWKYAASLDGRTAAADGSSQWITGQASRDDVHRLRLLADAVVIGVGTVLADDPSLTVRHHVAPRQPTRVVVDSDARTPVTARVLDGAAPVLVAVGRDADPARVRSLVAAGADVVTLPRRHGRVDLPALLSALGERDVVRVLLEGGATLAAAFVRAGLVDRVVGYHAPTLLGAGPPVVADLGIVGVAAALRLTVDSVESCGSDIRIIATPHHEEV